MFHTNSTPYDIWVVNADGTGPQRLTFEPGADTLPTWANVDITLIVAIDIKPGSSPNSINLSAAGVIPVAILGSDTFDATQVDPATVTLAGARVKLIGKGDRYACSVSDVNGDGYPDLVCHVVQRASSARIGQSGTSVPGPNTIRANGSDGVVVYESAQALVDGNTIANNNSAGITVEAAAATITNNTIQQNGSYGISVSNSGGARIGITDATTPGGNSIQSNGRDGVGIFNGSSANLFGNTIQGNGGTVCRSAVRRPG